MLPALAPCHSSHVVLSSMIDMLPSFSSATFVTIFVIVFAGFCGFGGGVEAAQSSSWANSLSHFELRRRGDLFQTRRPATPTVDFRHAPNTSSGYSKPFQPEILSGVKNNSDDVKWSEANGVEHRRNASVIHNISMILDNLLKDYDRSRRPGRSDSPTVISSNIVIKSMGPISELEMTYIMDCYFRQSWQDDRLKFDGPEETLSLNIKMLEGIWKPDTYFYNEQQSYVHTITRPNKLLRINKDGLILFSTRLTIKAKCPMQLHSFPMDKQSCPLVFGSYAYTSKEVVYTWDTDAAISLDKGMLLSQFDLVGSPQRNSTTKTRSGTFSTLQVNFHLQRHAGYFLIQIYVPCILIVVLSWVSFWINREATSDRIGLGITTVLTLSTLGIDTRNDLPKVHYATALDWFVIICFIFVIASLLEFAGVHYFTKVGTGEPLADGDGGESSDWEDVDVCNNEDNCAMEKSSSALAELPYVVDTVCPMSARRDHLLAMDAAENDADKTVIALKRVRCCIQFFYCLVGSDTYRRCRLKRIGNAQHHWVNSVSQIDKVSRLLFPITFCLLNFCYWVIYTTDAFMYDNWST